ncbi:MAG: hypothetical protein H6617_11185 [Bdellovibrionaceae bacterium]|nr:hypothetical protein [Pseudobdellovibrionaceae bacterium]
MRQLQVLFYVLLTANLALGSTSGRLTAATCQSRIIANSSVRVPISRYGQPYARAKNGYFGMLGEGFAEDHERLLDAGTAFSRPVLLDLGAGLSLTGLEWVSRGGQAVALSAHDFWDSMDKLTLVTADELKFYMHDRKYMLDQARDINITALKSASIILGIPFDEYAPWKRKRVMGFSVWRPDAELMADRVRELSTSFLGKRKHLEDLGLFVRATGMAENLLRDWERKVHLLADVYGAFFYSVDRRYIIELVYNALAPGGNAYLFYGLKREAKYGGPYDRVHLLGGGDMDLLDFLTTYAPNIFKEVEGSDSYGTYRVLRIHRDPAVAAVDLPLALDKKSIQWVSSMDGYSFPQLVRYQHVQSDRFLEMAN